MCVNLSTGQDCGIHSTQKCYPLAFGVPAALMVVSLGEILSVNEQATIYPFVLYMEES